MTDVADSVPPQRGLKILLTEGSSLSARQLLYALGPRHRIDILDPSPLCQCRFSRFVRRWYRCPSFADEPCAFLSFLGGRLKAGQYDVLLPPHEETYLLSRVRDALARRVALALPEFDSVTQLFSKLNFLRLLQELQLPHPEAAVVTDREELERWSDFPRFVKLDAGTAGQGVQLVHDQAELRAAVRQFEEYDVWSDGTPLLLQRVASGRQSVARAVFRDGEIVAVDMNEMRLRGVGGSAVARQSCYHPVVVDHLRRLGERLRWHGPLSLDFFFDESTDTPAYIDANPRIGDTANATLSGVNLCEAVVDVALGATIPVQSTIRNPQSAIPALRSHQGFLILMSRAVEGAGRRELARELWRQWRGTGLYENSLEEMTRPREDWLSIVPFAWVAGQLLVSPARAAKLVRNTVERYALTGAAARRIAAMPIDELVACLDSNAFKQRRTPND
jgi:predicted ATP-grasp superfamily ATP-dependent carboligase